MKSLPALILLGISPALFAANTPPPGYEALAAAEAAANVKNGPRHRPAQTIPVPTADVSPATQAQIAIAYPPHFNANPKTAAEWKELVEFRAAPVRAAMPALAEKLGVTYEKTKIGGVTVFTVTPKNIPPQNRNRLLLHVHGGAYVFSPGEAALPEAITMAGFGGFRVVSVDYRMPPDFPYPAAMDDAIAVWKELVKTHDPRSMAVFGTSTGGAMTLALALRAKDEKLPLPAALAPGTPWSDIGKVGDTYETNEWIDNILVTWDGFLGRAALLYANGRDLKDPQLSPIYGDFSGFPPTILTSGTRDLFLSNTVRTHRKLRRAGVVADLHVYEGQSHGGYMRDVDAPETREAFGEITAFFDRYLAK
jgi:monoterpene epsilon-lactone hydrolase